MKRVAIISALLGVGIMSFAVWAGAQTGGQPQNQPAAGQTAPAAGQTAPAAGQTAPAAGQTAPAAGTTPAPAAKRPPQAKTQPEFDAYKAAAGITDAAGLEKAADDFATKFPDSEIRILLYKNAARLYINANNSDKAEAMARRVLSLDGDDPEALLSVAEVIAERTRDADLDKDQRYAEAISMSQKAMKTLDTDLSVPPGTTQQQIDAYKAGRLSQAYSIIGAIDFKKEDYPAAQENLQKSIDAYPADPSAVDVLRLALTLDKQQKYPDALKWANRAVELTQDNTAIGTPARRERDRLQQLTGGTAPAPATPPKN